MRGHARLFRSVVYNAGMVNEKVAQRWLLDADKLRKEDTEKGDVWMMLLDEHVCEWLADQYTLKEHARVVQW